MRKWTREREKKLREMVEHGFVFSFVAEMLGPPITGEDVRDRADELRLYREIQQDDITDPYVLRMRGVWTRERLKEFKRMVLSGASLSELADHFHNGTTRILVKIRAMQRKGELPDDLSRRRVPR